MEITQKDRYLWKFYYDELKKLKTDYNSHDIFVKAAEIRDYCLKLNLPYSKYGILKNDIQFLVESSFHSEATEIEYENSPEILKNDKENLKKIIDNVLYQLDSLVRHPEEIKLKPIITKNKKGFFSWFKKNSAENEKEIKTDHAANFDVKIEPQNFKADMKVFISHKISENDIKLAVNFRQLLATKNLEGRIAEGKAEYELLVEKKVREQIQTSDFLVGIITNAA